MAKKRAQKERKREKSEEYDSDASSSVHSFFDDENVISVVKIPVKPKPKKRKVDEEALIEDYVLEFLTDLKANNEKPWMDLNRAVYEASKECFVSFVSHQLKELQPIDPHLSGIDPKKTLFRINRDIRFSTNKSVYKTHFASAFSRGSKKDGDAFYYLHIEPEGNSMIAAGIYCPATSILTRIRRGISENAQPLKDALANKELLQVLGAKDAEESMQKFMEGKKTLKTTPKGFAKDDPEIELLRLQSYTIGKRFTDEQVLSPEFPQLAASALASFQPFVYALNDYFDA